jgi:immunity protein 52 of polymorphic toxin system
VSTRPYLGAYWGDRPERAEDCGQRLAECLKDFRDINVALSNWYQAGSSEQEAEKYTVEPSPHGLTWLFKKGRIRRDDNGRPIENLGFSTAFGNGQSGPLVSVSVNCGGWAAKVGVMNSFRPNSSACIAPGGQPVRAGHNEASAESGYQGMGP